MSRRIPSTPKSQSWRTQQSTTPAGAPPSYLTDKSTTPAGPPPQSTFGSSFNPSNNTFGRRGFSVPDDEDDEDADFEEYDDELDLPQASGLPLAASPRGLKRSRNGNVRPVSDMAAIAKDMGSHSNAPELRESDNMVVQTEHLVSDLNAHVRRQPAKADTILTETAAQLTQLWSQHSDATTKQGSLGPKATDGFSKANYLASLLLQLHLPHTNKPSQTGASRPLRSSGPSIRPQYDATIPQALLGWLDKYHKPFPDDFNSVHLCQPSPSAHESFWDILYASTLRGKFERTIRLLKDAGWEHADTAIDDGAEKPGFVGAQLQNTIEVASRCIGLLETCPAVQYGDWDVKGVEWTLFRQRTVQALEDLESFAEASDMDQSRRLDNVFERSLRDTDVSLSAASRRAESRVPWSVYENLKLLYMLILGSVDDVLLASQDWLESSIYLTVWWDGSEDSNLDADFRKSSVRKSTTSRPRAREVDVATLAAYRRRLADAFAMVTDNPEEGSMKVNTMDPVQVSIACIFEDDVASVIGMLRRWSMPITIAIVELAISGNWLPSTRPKNHQNLLEQGFSKEDLIVLSHGPTEINPDEIDRDDLLSEYAELLSAKRKIQEKEGWELAVSVLSRLNHAQDAKTKISGLFDRTDLADGPRVDKVLNVCSDLGLTEQGRDIAERYANGLAESTQSYGSALIYYARAMAASKLKSTISLLTSMSLLHSTAMPTAKTLDPQLASLIDKDRPALKELARTDLEAATLLSNSLSGYATLRKFYDLRDQEIGTNLDKSIQLRPLERKRLAASSLCGLIRSAADCVPGGLFDPNAESVVPIDGLLALFGEALPLLGHPTRIFTQEQTFALLGAVEDYTAAPSRIQQNANGLLTAAMNAYYDSHDTASGILRKSRSDASGSSWDLLASSSMSMMAPSQTKGTPKVQRAWDWRFGLNEVWGKGAGGAQVVQLFRQALVKEVGKGWGGMLNW